MKPAKEARPVPQRPSIIGKRIRRFFTLGALAIVAVFGLLSLFGENGLLDRIRLQAMHHRLEGEILELREEREEFLAEIARLKDPRYVEFLARDRLGLMKANEIFIILGEEKKK